jgi:hypothetical protein
MSKLAALIRPSYDTDRKEDEMLYELIIQGENDRWNTFRRAEREAQSRAGLRDDAEGGRLRTLIARRRRLAPGAAQRAPQVGPTRAPKRANP